MDDTEEEASTRPTFGGRDGRHCRGRPATVLYSAQDPQRTRRQASRDGSRWARVLPCRLFETPRRVLGSRKGGGRRHSSDLSSGDPTSAPVVSTVPPFEGASSTGRAGPLLSASCRTVETLPEVHSFRTVEALSTVGAGTQSGTGLRGRNGRHERDTRT